MGKIAVVMDMTESYTLLTLQVGASKIVYTPRSTNVLLYTTCSLHWVVNAPKDLEKINASERVKTIPAGGWLYEE